MPVLRPQPDDAVSSPQATPPQCPQLMVLDSVQVAVGGRTILDVPRWDVPAGAHVGIAGVSGSGKTTLLHVMAGIRAPTVGQVRWGATDVAALTPQQGDAWRRATIGLVFQDFQLIPELSAIENVLLPGQFAAWQLPPAMRPRARDALTAMGIGALSQRVGLMSRGEQQRVAIARAVLHDPALILADEPTASLDPVSAVAVVDLLVGAARQTGATLIIVSHDPSVLSRLERTLAISGGMLTDGP
jgi:putative ABC transport system ATP-binding protein